MYQLESLEQSLKQFFGYDNFREGQKQIIEQALQNRDLLIIMPTGGGKSLCFQLPALLNTGITIVISPLIALMQDQVDSLNDNGIGATFINSTLTTEAIYQRESDILNRKIKLLYVAPERLVSERFIPFLDRIYQEISISTFAIDEAHCISEWGHDFRPEYRRIKELRQRYPNIPISALTATATKRVQQDIISQLQLRQPAIHISSFNRPNLYYEVKEKNNRSYQQLLQEIKQQKGSGIVYCMSRKSVDDISNRLQQDNIKALPYHAGLTDEKRTYNQNCFIRDDIQVIVATVAFGMGINKPDVRFVFHYDLPKNIESYYQESGRAGRDSEPSKCVIFFSLSDVNKIKYIINQKENQEEQRIAKQQLEKIIEYAEGTECRRTIQLSYFGERFKGNCANCDNCLNPKNTEDWTIEAQKFLSCVARCNERFGMMHIIDVLRGSKNKKIEQNGHHLLSTYGIGKDHTTDQWKHLCRTLLHQGLVSETSDGYRVLKLNKLSWEILRKQRTVNITVKKKDITQIIGETNNRHVETELLLDRLKRLRKHIADVNNIPPYIIFQDGTLRLLALLRPKNIQEFSQISGINSYKTEQYGDTFLSEIRAFSQEQSLPTALPSDTQMKTLQLYQQGFNLMEIAERRRLTTGTISHHLSELILLNQPVNINDFVAEDKQKAILKMINKLGDLSLKTLRDNLGDNYSYDELKLVRAWREKQNK
jgi:ATP-dependent DNA helicase RecQ